jgi:hypothetical protein
MFRHAADAANALGSNILGGLFGGALEALSIFWGIKAMALLAIAVYGAAAFSYRGRQANLVSVGAGGAMPHAKVEIEAAR